MRGSMQGAVAAVFLVGLAGAGCARNQERAAADQNATASPSPTSGAYAAADNTMRDDAGKNQPSASDISSNPVKYEGQRVTLKSDVKTVMPNGMFQLKDGELLVLSPSAEPGENQEITVSGTVRTYSAPELKTKYTWFKSNGRVDAQFKDRAVIVADSIVTADGRELVAAGSALPASAGEPGQMAGHRMKQEGTKSREQRDADKD